MEKLNKIIYKCLETKYTNILFKVYKYSSLNTSNILNGVERGVGMGIATPSTHLL